MEIKGTVKRIIYHNDASNFFIFTFEDAGNGKIEKAKGSFNLDLPKPGMTVRLSGEWEPSAKYGNTFAVTGLTHEVTFTDMGLEKYLLNYIPNIGVVTARKVVKHFGKDTLDVLNKDIRRVEEVPGLTAIQMESLMSEWGSHNDYRRVAIELLAMGLPDSSVKKIYDKFGTSTLETITNNPYVLTTVHGIGFLTADKIALTIGIPYDSTYRIASCMEHVVVEARMGGHLYLHIKEIVEGMEKLVKSGAIASFGRFLTQENLKDALKALRDAGRAVIEGSNVYITSSFLYEDGAARAIASLVGYEFEPFIKDVSGFIEEHETIFQIKFSEEQREGLEAIVDHKVLLITGGPGTGKTSLMKALVRLLKAHGKAVTLLSPTGIAAKRLSSVAGEDASTIHRCLGYKGATWELDARNKLVTDVVIVDEASMLDQEVVYRLLDALPVECLVIFVGDDAQLPSVGAGNVLSELMGVPGIARVHLTHIFRQEEASDIIINSHLINKGLVPEIRESPDRDFRFDALHGDTEVLNAILAKVRDIQDSGDRDLTFQVLSPKWKGTLGVTNLNNEIREILNPLGTQREITLKNGVVVREGDRIIVTSNNYDLGVYNGETGTVFNIDSKESMIWIKLKDAGKSFRNIPISYTDAPDMLSPAFCITIHKSQGQEMDHIIFPFMRSFSIQLQRNLLYTAVTRAKQKVHIYGEWSAIATAVANNEVARRNTMFARRIIGYLEAQV